MKSAFLITVVSVALLSLLGLTRQRAEQQASPSGQDTTDEEVLFVG